jgi:hypothetical protein
LKDVQWLVGCWEMSRGTLRTIERWTAPTGNAMVGESRTTVSGTDRESEQLRLFSRGDTLVYESLPSGQTLTEFRLTSSGQGELTFANPAHDFPQRIIYRRVGADSLIARIEGDRAGRRAPVSFPFRRITCPATLESPVSLARTALQPRYDDLVTRESVYGGASNGWFADNATTDFRHVMWSTSGPAVPVAPRELLARANESMRANPNRVPVTNRRFTAALEQLLVRGDTVEALVTTRTTWNFVDTAGVYGTAGVTRERDGTQRRIDTWVRTGADWRLREVAVISEEASIDSRVILRNGKRVVP